MDNTITVTPQFVLAGDATFTVSNGTSRHFTFNVKRAEGNDKFLGPAWYLKVLTGPDNTNDYAYMGMIVANTQRPKLDPIIKLTAKSRVNHSTDSYKVASWALRAIWQVARGEYKLPNGYSIKHIGRCGRCGAALTHPASLDTGLGPACAEMSGVEWTERPVQVATFDFGRK